MTLAQAIDKFSGPEHNLMRHVSRWRAPRWVRWWMLLTTRAGDQRVRAEDEWCAEAYMDTDYSTLTQKNFEETVKNYAVFPLLGMRSVTEDADAGGQ